MTPDEWIRAGDLLVFSILGSLYSSVLSWLATGRWQKRWFSGALIMLPVIAGLAGQHQLPPASYAIGDFAGLAAVAAGLLVAVGTYRLLDRSAES
jgi:hypothetical protein